MILSTMNPSPVYSFMPQICIEWLHLPDIILGDGYTEFMLSNNVSYKVTGFSQNCGLLNQLLKFNN